MSKTSKFKVVYNTDGEFVRVEPPKNHSLKVESGQPLVHLSSTEAGELSLRTVETFELVHKPGKGKSVCCIIHLGRLYCWC